MLSAWILKYLTTVNSYDQDSFVRILAWHFRGVLQIMDVQYWEQRGASKHSQVVTEAACIGMVIADKSNVPWASWHLRNIKVNFHCSILCSF